MLARVRAWLVAVALVACGCMVPHVPGPATSRGGASTSGSEGPRAPPFSCPPTHPLWLWYERQGPDNFDGVPQERRLVGVSPNGTVSSITVVSPYGDERGSVHVRPDDANSTARACALLVSAGTDFTAEANVTVGPERHMNDSAVQRLTTVIDDQFYNFTGNQDAPGCDDGSQGDDRAYTSKGFHEAGYECIPNDAFAAFQGRVDAAIP
ncbi:MAG: hypothetical protein ACYDBQ_01100 [Thermoplasmatota archaeon]